LPCGPAHAGWLLDEARDGGGLGVDAFLALVLGVEQVVDAVHHDVGDRLVGLAVLGGGLVAEGSGGRGDAVRR
jgi:hypothetical protein